MTARQRHFVPATVHSERSFIDEPVASSKCHNFLSISSQATACAPDHHAGVTSLLPCYLRIGQTFLSRAGRAKRAIRANRAAEEPDARHPAGMRDCAAHTVAR